MIMVDQQIDPVFLPNLSPHVKSAVDKPQTPNSVSKSTGAIPPHLRMCATTQSLSMKNVQQKRKTFPLGKLAASLYPGLLGIIIRTKTIIYVVGY